MTATSTTSNTRVRMCLLNPVASIIEELKKKTQAHVRRVGFSPTQPPPWSQLSHFTFHPVSIGSATEHA